MSKKEEGIPKREWLFRELKDFCFYICYNKLSLDEGLPYLITAIELGEFQVVKFLFKTLNLSKEIKFDYFIVCRLPEIQHKEMAEIIKEYCLHAR